MKPHSPSTAWFVTLRAPARCSTRQRTSSATSDSLTTATRSTPAASSSSKAWRTSGLFATGSSASREPAQTNGEAGVSPGSYLSVGAKRTAWETIGDLTHVAIANCSRIRVGKSNERGPFVACGSGADHLWFPRRDAGWAHWRRRWFPDDASAHPSVRDQARHRRWNRSGLRGGHEDRRRLQALAAEDGRRAAVGLARGRLRAVRARGGVRTRGPGGLVRTGLRRRPAHDPRRRAAEIGRAHV